MVSFKSAALSSLAAVGLVQYAPAPFLAIPVVISIDMGSAAAWAGAAGGIAGGAAGTATAIENAHKKRSVEAGSFENIKRQDDGQYGTKLAWEECRDDLKSHTVGFQVPEPGSLLITGMPATCMTLSTTITGKFNAGNPVPEGNDSIKFTNLSDDYFNQVVDALRARGD